MLRLSGIWTSGLARTHSTKKNRSVAHEASRFWHKTHVEKRQQNLCSLSRVYNNTLHPCLYIYCPARTTSLLSEEDEKTRSFLCLYIYTKGLMGWDQRSHCCQNENWSSAEEVRVLYAPARIDLRIITAFNTVTGAWYLVTCVALLLYFSSSSVFGGNVSSGF